MKVSIRFHSASQPVNLENVVTTYQKESFFCVRLKNEITYKYPICNIYDVKESEAVDPSYADTIG
jgi:hypothetical protein